MIIKYFIERIYKVKNGTNIFSVEELLRGIKKYEQTMGYVDEGYMDKFISTKTARDYPFNDVIKREKQEKIRGSNSQFQNGEGIGTKDKRTTARGNSNVDLINTKDKRSVNLENIKKGEHSDEFRRIQEESRRLSSSISQQERVNSFDDSLYERIRGILSREIKSFRGSYFDSSRLVVDNEN